MSEEYESTVVIREYEGNTRAVVHVAALEAAGITAVLTGDVPNAASFSMFGRLNYAPVQLAVPASQREEAELILANLDDSLEEGWEDAAEEIDGWLCLNCDTIVSKDHLNCPACGTIRADETPQDDLSEDD